ncbi:13393_t:CDS:2 [Ambispora gerdemannii]|uniref:GrpE protein homolog, mitochondrial n=1 Tax=Ambispora gerdemannii TaxID=144530 RepID=A0A9N9AEJ2_9GLOM|nr:13393_t:CDS:2 [Ambispora gerdemannii]
MSYTSKSILKRLTILTCSSGSFSSSLLFRRGGICAKSSSIPSILTSRDSHISQLHTHRNCLCCNSQTRGAGGGGAHLIKFFGGKNSNDCNYSNVNHNTSSYFNGGDIVRRMYSNGTAEKDNMEGFDGWLNGGEAEAVEEKEVDERIAVETGTPEGVDTKHGGGIDPRDKQIAELKNHYLRSLADQENLRERTRREVEHTAQFAIQKFARDLLNTADILNLALSSVPKEALENAAKENPHLHNLYTGVKMTEQDLLKTLKNYGVEQINPLDEKFDPNVHEAMFQAPVEGKEEGTVFTVQKIGYKLNGRVIRPPQNIEYSIRR